ncbi:ZNF385A [Cervus elaphus hippelaphus]|uniref:ZNF385A n=1 Tax=Cervus elaphus hippelaphus TaxID=46360 RepID=A0A212DFN6_CEREH|nr:ZNF385A [Cervus elaphus hippelaphus]
MNHSPDCSPWGSLSRAGPLPLLRQPPIMQPPLDLKQILPFPLEPAPTLGLFSNYSAMDPVQKAVLSHTFGGPLLKTKRPIISCNVCQIRFNSQSQAEAHYKGNRHARRVKGIEAAKTRGREPSVREPGDPAPPGSTPPNGDGVAPRPASPHPSADLVSSILSPLPKLSSAFISLFLSPHPTPTQVTQRGARVRPPGRLPQERENHQVAVNSLSQLEAHNKGTKHKTILEARSGLGPIKAYPRLGPPAPGEPEAPAQDRTFHCEICNVKVNSEVQLKQVGLRPSPRILWRAPAKGEGRRRAWKGQARVLRCEYPAPWRRLLSPWLTGPHPLVLTAHFQPAAPRWRGREAQPATEPSQEA